ncbi:hypothetical protein CRENBAI_018358 [Crenichthys baileyi]|uniref:Uncharacterized protein n=1 Tax=Crenichthys baileyi TaxID=28760 RepID=A0AAV9R9V9_9TELE
MALLTSRNQLSETNRSDAGLRHTGYAHGFWESKGLREVPNTTARGEPTTLEPLTIWGTRSSGSLHTHSKRQEPLCRGFRGQARDSLIPKKSHEQPQHHRSDGHRAPIIRPNDTPVVLGNSFSTLLEGPGMTPTDQKKPGLQPRQLLTPGVPFSRAFLLILSGPGAVPFFFWLVFHHLIRQNRGENSQLSGLYPFGTRQVRGIPCIFPISHETLRRSAQLKSVGILAFFGTIIDLCRQPSLIPLSTKTGAPCNHAFAGQDAFPSPSLWGFSER